MAEPTKLAIKNEQKSATPAATEGYPFESLRREIDRAFEMFLPARWPLARSIFDTQPFTGRELNWAKSPAVDVVEKDNEYEITAELPGIDEKNVDVKFANGVLTIKGEKQEEKEEKQKDYYLSERHYGSFQRAFRVPEGVDPEKVAAEFKNGVLKVTLPKSAEAKQQEKQIPVKAA